MSDSDLNLLNACRRGDMRAWERLVRKYERLVYSIALNHGLTADDAADITQLTFTILLESLDSLRDDSNLASWLGTVARRHSWRLLKRAGREDTQADEDLADSAWLMNRPGDDSIRRWELAEWLDGGLRRIDERCRRLLVALYFDPDEPSYTEIAQRLGMAPGSIGPTRARCLERLREILAPDRQPAEQT